MNQKAKKPAKRKTNSLSFLGNLFSAKRKSGSGEYITEYNSLVALCNEIKEGDILAIDTEFIRRTTYFPILSLIQIGHKGKIYVVDCLAKFDITPILDIINNAKIKKILHSASQDLEIFYQETSLKPKNIEDTQILANFCGYDFNSSYAKLTKDICGATLDKQMQNSNWLKRPLSPNQIEYAKIDVVHLEKIFKKLKKKVEKKGLIDSYYQDIDMLIDSLSSDNIGSLFKVFVKGRKKNLRQNKVPIAKVCDILLWRDKMAQKIDKPRRHLISDDDLESVIIGKKVSLRLGDKLTKSLDELLKKSNYSLDLQGESYNINYDKNEFVKIRGELIKIAKKYGVDERFVISSSDLQAIFYQGKDYGNLTKWRRAMITELKNKFGYEK